MEATVRLFILTSVLAISGCSRMVNDQRSGQDGVQHFITSAMLAVAGSKYTRHQGNSRDRSVTIGLMFSVSLGASEELWDSRPAGSGWSWKDFAWDIASASTGYTVWQLAYY